MKSSNDQDFDRYWGSYVGASDLAVESPFASPGKKSERSCLPAREFRDLVTRHVMGDNKQPDTVSIQQAKLNLFDLFWQFYPMVASPYHFDLPDTAHRCLFDEFQETAYELLQLQRKAAPPQYERIVIHERRTTAPDTSETSIRLGDKRFKRSSNSP